MGATTLLKLSLVAVSLGVAWRFLITRREQLPPVVEGFFQPEYRPVAELFRKLVEDGTERGASFAVYQYGKPLVDLRGGYADPESQRPWREDTITMAWSVTKGVSAMCIAKLVDRGLLDYKAEVRKYWPEFDQNGKGNITLEMLLSHQGGLVGFGGELVTFNEYKNDWPKIERLMASSTPMYPPGTRVSYHAVTFAMYVDALIRRVDPKHRTLAQFFRDEIAEPFGIDFQIGLPLEQFYRTSRLFLPSLPEVLALYLDPPHWPFIWAMLSTDPKKNALYASMVIKDSDKISKFNNPYDLDAGLGSMMGFGTAGSLAKLYSILANGGTVGKQTMLAKSVVDQFSIPVTKSIPKDILLIEVSRGFVVSNNTQGDLLYGHPGYGGQQANADPKNKLGISYLTNFMSAKVVTPPDQYLELQRVFYECFEKHAANKAK